jgi:hypothetical protein
VQKKPHTIAAADNAATDTNTLVIQNEGAIGIQVDVTGTITLTPEVTMDNPAEPDAVWVAIKVWDLVAQAALATFIADGVAYVDVPGFGGFRLRQTAGAGTAISWLSETVASL